MRWFWIFTIVLAATIGLALPRSGRAAERRPNVLLIAADDRLEWRMSLISINPIEIVDIGLDQHD